MSANDWLIDERFPRSNKYHPEWVVANVSGAANPLWLTEWLTTATDLQPGMRVLDLGCGRASSSIFLHRDTYPAIVSCHDLCRQELPEATTWSNAAPQVPGTSCDR